MKALPSLYLPPLSISRYSILLLFFNFSITYNGFSQANYLLLGDRYIGSIASGESLLSLHKAVYEVEGTYLKDKLFEENSFSKKIAGISYRGLKYILLDANVDYMLGLLQHEVCGHGARYREYGYVNNSYILNPFPFAFYRDAFGWSKRGYLKSPRDRSYHEDMLISAAGSEAQFVMANQMVNKWLQRGSMHYRESWLYIGNFYNLLSPVHIGSDPGSYLLGLNFYYGNTSSGSAYLSEEELKKLSIIKMFDPFQYIAAYTFFYTYLLRGKAYAELPMVHFGPFRYLPSFSIGLAPYGPEINIKNYALLNTKIFSVIYRQGSFNNNLYWGINANGDNLINNKFFTVGIKTHLWDQPEITIGGDSIINSKAGLGGALMANIDLKLIKGKRPVGLYAQVGYKTTGYIEGERLNACPILRFGFSFSEALN